MLTRRDLITAVRRRLHDTDVDPAWSHDDAIHAIDEAIRRYSTRLPRQVTWAPVVPVGSREIELPPHIDGRKVSAVQDDHGCLWRPWTAQDTFISPPLNYAAPSIIACWRTWGELLMLSHPAERTGLWNVQYTANRKVPSDDASPLDIDEGDESILVAQVTTILLDRQAVHAGIRGRDAHSGHPLLAGARSARMDADALMDMRVRETTPPRPDVVPIRRGRWSVLR